MIPLTKLQKEIMREFYQIAPTKVIYDKKKRNKLWKIAKDKSGNIDFTKLSAECPALQHQISQSYQTGHNIQSAVFSECVYSQTLANLLKLELFVNCKDFPEFVPADIVALLQSYSLLPRYVYSTKDKRRMLIQAGGCNGIDSALITVIDLTIYTIEFKEPGAKTSEPDLPKYNEQGNLALKGIQDFKKTYPQFTTMLGEQKGLNFFEHMGNNIHNFTPESINEAVSNNYSNINKKYADVICTEDSEGYLVMLPSNQISQWAETEGEIRPAGRNHYRVWTPKALKKFLKQENATFSGNSVAIEKSKLELRKARGSAGKISGYKINPLFFVRIEHCTEKGDKIEFNINDVRQLNPTITAKMFFKNLKYSDVKSFYQKSLQ